MKKTFDDPKDARINELEDRVRTLEMVVRGYEDKYESFSQEHRIASLRSGLETLASGQCLSTAKEHAQAVLNSDYNISLTKLARQGAVAQLAEAPVLEAGGEGASPSRAIQEQ